MAFSMNDVLWREFLQAEEIDSSPLVAVYRGRSPSTTRLFSSDAGMSTKSNFR